MSSSSSSSSEGAVWKRKGSRGGGGEGIEMENGCCTTTTKSGGGGGGGGSYNNVDYHQQKKKKNKNKKKKKTKSTMNNGKTEEKRYKLVTYRELPEYMKDNEYILGYYRSDWPIKAAFFSLFRWHNETLNIWTHLLGFVLFVGLTMANLMQVPQLAQLLHKFTRSFAVIPAGTNASFNSKDFFSSIESTIDFARMMHSDLILTTSTEIPVTKWPFFVFLAGSMFCLLTSSICHLFCCHSHRLNLLLLRFDYVGIVVMIITSFFPPIYYIFQCEPRWQFVYLTGITVMGIFTIVTLLAPSASTSGCRTFRASLFVAMGFFGIIPAIHATVVNWNEPRRWMTLAYETAMALSYAIGTLFYVSRIPERWKPGNFDLAGHSHQIFHVFVILGALSHYGAVLIFLDWRGTVGCNHV